MIPPAMKGGVGMKETETGGSIANDSGTYTVEDIASILNIGKNSAYSLTKSGVFQMVRIGKTIRISKTSFNKWLSGQ